MKRHRYYLLGTLILSTMILLFTLTTHPVLREFRLSNGDTISLLTVTCGTIHCDPELPLLQRGFLQLQRRGKIPKNFLPSLSTNVVVVPTQIPADIFWFRTPPPTNPRLYLIARFYDQNGQQIDIAHNFLALPSKAILVLHHSIPERDRLKTIRFFESDFPNNDMMDHRRSAALEVTVPFVSISAPDHEFGEISTTQAGLRH